MCDNGPAVGVNRQRSQASVLASIAREIPAMEIAP